MSFGISGLYLDENKVSRKFEGPIGEEGKIAKKIIVALPDYSIQIIKIYDHGAPGIISNWDVFDLEAMLKKKMMVNGQIQLLGCSTAGIEGREGPNIHWVNSIGGWGYLARAAMYSWMEDVNWQANLARDLSLRIKDVWVLGLGGISFPLSRAFDLVGKEGYEPKGLMADRKVYRNGARSQPPDGSWQW